MVDEIEGTLLVDKPKNWTSFDVVNKIRSVIAHYQEVKPRQIKVGHSGTLDPAATGLLVLAVGKTTKKLQNMIKLDKTYMVEATLGATSSTGDIEGEITTSKKQEKSNISKIKEVLKKFTGEIEQVPPKYSAIKIDGKRAYKLAREGKEVKLEPRQVTIYFISDISFSWPKLTFTAQVSSGTYVRSLVEDIGKELGCGAYMSNLRRTRIGKFNLGSAVRISKTIQYEDVITNLNHEPKI